MISPPPTVLVAHDPSDLVRQVATLLTRELAQAVAEHGRAVVSLAGGQTPRRLYQHLAEPSRAAQLPWGDITVLWGDERLVPHDHPQNNAHMARSALLDRLAVAPAALHPVPTHLPHAAAAQAYGRIARSLPLHVALLGLGPDGHTASLFPETPDLGTDRVGALATFSPVPPTPRVSLTLGTFARASTVIVLVNGAGKADILAAVLRDFGQDETLFPASRLRAANGRPVLFAVDRDAASRIPSNVRTRSAGAWLED